jgi:Domain of unknown function (DUF3536)/Glycosyl hydrolase family 57
MPQRMRRGSRDPDVVTRGRLVIHGHFHQPIRADPFTGRMPVEPSASPYSDWNARIDAECYRPNVQRGNFAHISFDISPALADWLAAADPATHSGIVAADRISGSAMALPYHHTILPLASLADRRTELRWGLRDFELRFGRPARGIWLPETAVDLPTLRLAADAGLRYTILAPWQCADAGIDTRRPYRVELGDRRYMVVVFYDGVISGGASFEPSTTADADRFARERVAPRLAGTAFADGTPGLVVVATDGELYGHHQTFRDLFLQRLVSPGPDAPDRGFDVVDLPSALDEPSVRPFPAVRIAERTSWSCHHGVARWAAECPDAPDGRWKAPLRAALERLAAAIDAVTEHEIRPVELFAARDAYVDVVAGAMTPAAFGARWVGQNAPPAQLDRFLALLEAQRWRLAMFASDAWFWDDPVRLETRQVLRAAGRAARLVDDTAGTSLERRLLDDLTLLASPSTRIDGAAIYRSALREVGQRIR